MLTFNSSGQWLFKNYRDALDRIKVGEPQLQEMLQKLKLSTQDLEKFLEDERAYLNNVDREDSDDAVAKSAEYVQLLLKLQDAQ
jgi:hypothetical protein